MLAELYGKCSWHEVASEELLESGFVVMVGIGTLVCIGDSYELLLNDSREGISISAFNRCLHSSTHCAMQFLPAGVPSMST